MKHNITETSILVHTRCHAIAKTTARCAHYMSALKIVCKHKSSRRLRKNLHITILSLFGGESNIPTNVITVPKRYRRPDRRTIYTVASPLGKNRET